MEDKLEQEFATYEQAVALKELGFDYDCFLYWYKSEPENLLLRRHDHILNNTKCVPAPLKQQVFKWFIENHNLYTSIDYNLKFNVWVCEWRNKNGKFGVIGSYNIYEKAENACIDKLIELTKTK